MAIGSAATAMVGLGWLVLGMTRVHGTCTTQCALPSAPKHMRVHQSGVGLHPLTLPLCCLCAGKLRPDLFEDTSLGPLHDGLCKGQVGRGRLPWRGRADRLAPLD